MNLAPLAQILTAHAQTADNNTALALSDTHETLLDPKTHLTGGIALPRPFQPNQPHPPADFGADQPRFEAPSGSWLPNPR